MPRLGAREWMFGVNCFVAAMLALYVSCSLGLDRPYWAMLTVYVTSQPLAGAVRSKALYRLLGTAVGATASILMVGSLYGSPELLSLALALWVGGCLFLSLLDRRPTSYLFMLAGYTAALIAFPNVGHPGNIFTLAALRVQEIGIGVVCAAFVHSIVFPRSVGAALTGQIRKMLADASRWSADALVGSPSHQCAAERRRFAADVTELHLKATHLPYDTAHFGLTRALLTTLLDHFVLLLPLVTAIEDRLALLGGASNGWPRSGPMCCAMLPPGSGQRPRSLRLRQRVCARDVPPWRSKPRQPRIGRRCCASVSSPGWTTSSERRSFAAPS